MLPNRRITLLALSLAACGGSGASTQTTGTETGAGETGTSEVSAGEATTAQPMTGEASTGPTSGPPTTSEGATGDATTASSGGSEAGTTEAGTTEAGTTAAETTAADGSSGGSGDSTGEPLDCTPGQVQDCYDGPEGTAGVGLCKAGTATCDPMGAWGPCLGAVLPAPESCEAPGDEDCDGADPCVGDGGHVWSRVWGAGSDEMGMRLGFDGAGNLVLAAKGASTSDFGGGPLPSAGSWDLYLAKFGPDGAHLWSKRFGDAASQFGDGHALAVSAAGEIVVSGEFNGSIDFGGGPLINQSFGDGFLARLTPEGAHVWSKSFKAGSFVLPQDLALDKDGNVLLVGHFTGSLDLGGGSMKSAGGYDAFVGKFTAAGAHAWSLRFGDAQDQYARGVAADASGDVIVGGAFRGTINPGGGQLTSAGDFDVFVARWSPVGNAEWGKRFGDAGMQRLNKLAIDGKGRIVLVGETNNGSIDFGGGPLPANALRSFAAQLGGDGGHVWSKLLSGGLAVASWVAIDGLDNAIVTGSFSGTNDFGGGALVSEGGRDVFALKLAPGGAHVWSKRFGDFQEQEGWASAASKGGNLAITGFFKGGVNFGGGPANNKGANDGFVAVFSP